MQNNIEVDGLTSSEIKMIGLNALENALGTTGTVRFLQMRESDRGDYTEEREEILKCFPQSVEELARMIMDARSSQQEQQEK